MAFTDDEKVQIRYYAGYPDYGKQPQSSTGWRFMTIYGDLEYRLNNMTTYGEVQTRKLVATLESLEDAAHAVQQNMDTSRAAVWYRNKDELKENYVLYYKVRAELCNRIGCQKGPSLGGSINRSARWI